MKQHAVLLQVSSVFLSSILVLIPASCGGTGQPETGADVEAPATDRSDEDSAAYADSRWAVQVLGAQTIPVDPETDFVGAGSSILSVELSIEYRGVGEPVLGTLEQVVLTTSDGEECPIYGIGSAQMEPEEGFNVYGPRDSDYSLQYMDTVDGVDVTLFALSAAMPDQESILSFFDTVTVMRFGFEAPTGSTGFRLVFADAQPVEFDI